MIDLCVKIIRGKKGTPSFEDRVGHFQHTNVDPRIIRSQARNQILRDVSNLCNKQMSYRDAHIHESVPTSPEVGVCNHADGFS